MRGLGAGMMPVVYEAGDDSVAPLRRKELTVGCFASLNPGRRVSLCYFPSNITSAEVNWLSATYASSPGSFVRRRRQMSFLIPSS